MIRTVAWHEFWFTIRKKSYYLVTLGMPLLVLGYLGLISLIVLMTVPGEVSRRGKPTGIVDEAGILTAPGGPLVDAVIGETVELEPDKSESLVPAALPAELNTEAAEEQIKKLTTQKVVLLKDVESGQQQLQDEEYKSIVVIPADHLETGKVDTFRKRGDVLSMLDSGGGTGWLSKLIRTELLRRTDLSEDELQRVKNFAKPTEYELNSEGEFEKVNLLSKGLSLGLPLAVSGLLVFALMMNASALLASIAEEKENKVMEVIVSSVSADQLLFGKVLGIVCAGLLQIAIWMLMVSVIPALSMLIMNEVVDYEFNLVQLLISGVFMVVGFVFYGSLLAGMGSLGSTYKDCQQLSAAIIICACVPMMMPTVFISDPNSIVPRVLSMVPLFSPIGMALRLGSGEIAIWEVAVSLLILVICTWIAIKVSAKLFRAGTLMRGKPPGVRDIWKVLVENG
ncbi:MAG: ABC transporter permease [Planctomycetota bacterium]